MIRLPPKYALPKSPIGLADAALLFGLFLTFYVVAKVGVGFFVAFRPPNVLPGVSLDASNLPYYAVRSTMRMFIALAISVVFTLSYGYAAAKSKQAEKVLVPLLDVLQSVPVLGFLSVTVTGFIALFPGSLLGLECASIFAIFTGQAWNMTFSFYHSLITLPKELDDAAKVFRFSKWRRFVSIEVPAAMIGLVWNGMMSFGGGWFFVAASEAISVLNRQYTLPGIGSYVAKAVEAKDVHALGLAILTMAVVIIVVDQLFWRPVVAWSEKFRMDKSAAANQAHSWLLDLLRAARLPRTLNRYWRRIQARLPKWRLPHIPARLKIPIRIRLKLNGDLILGVVLGIVVVVAIYFGARFVTTEVLPSEIGFALWLGFLTLLRVTGLLIFSSLVWTPVGVAIGSNPRLARIAQPVVLLCASFPANFLFPAATILFLKLGLNINWGSMLLMALGAQWYILFNTIAGAMAVPNDLREMAANMRMGGWHRWQRLIIPSIFPAWVTGAVTASGGAWNASIVAEVVTWGNKTLHANGLGSYIAKATEQGDWPRIVLGVTLMCIFVVGINRLVWRRLYSLAETRYRLG
ncbi:MAG: ABC transporter permease [Fimbriimonadales bacterium]